MFVSSVGNTLAVRTIRVYLSGVKYYCLKLGQNLDLNGMEGLKMIIRGIKRMQGNSMVRPLRNPIEIHQLILLADLLRKYYCTTDYEMLMAALLLGYFGLLRCSEFTAETECRYERGSTLTKSDISFHTTGLRMYVNIKASKTDPFRVRTIVTIPILASTICPVLVMLRYIYYTCR